MDPITLFAAATAATIIGQGGHQQSGYRDTGCSIETRVEVRSERTGKVLYTHNPGCAGIRDSSEGVVYSAQDIANAAAMVAVFGRRGAGDEMNGAPESPDFGNGNGNASANNGHGGNGGPDNGHGNGHGRD